MKKKIFGTQSLDLSSTGGLNLTYFEILARHLADSKIVKADKWHTVQFYMMSDKKSGLWIDSIRVSNVKRRNKNAQEVL